MLLSALQHYFLIDDFLVADTYGESCTFSLRSTVDI